MALRLSLRRSTTAGAVPAAANINAGELCLNLADGLVFFKNSAGTVLTLSPFGAIRALAFGGKNPVVASYIAAPMPWNGTILGVRAAVLAASQNSVTASVSLLTSAVGTATDVTGLAGIAYSSSSVARVNATGANTFTAGQMIRFAITAVSGTVPEASFSVEIRPTS